VRLRWLLLVVAAAGCAPVPFACSPAPKVQVGSKKFTESVILGEMATQLARSTGAEPVVHRRQLGGTQVLWKALVRGYIDVYPEYTGTISEEILAGQDLPDEEAMRRALAERGVRMSRSLGFNDTYAIGMKKERARDLGIEKISDLRSHPDLKFGFSEEFMNRKEGWPSLRTHYDLPQSYVRRLDHDLAYNSLKSGATDATDVYSTDAEIRYHGLRVLEDDLHHFPAYQAVWLYRADLEEREPDVVRVLRGLEGRISEAAMIDMNAQAKNKEHNVPESQVAAEFLAATLGIQVAVMEEGVVKELLRHTVEHLYLVAISLAAAIVIAVPLGIVAARRPAVGQVILSVVGIIQTIPSLALLVMLIPLLGIAEKPAIVALFLYSLLPIVRNTYAGLHDIPVSIRETAQALGLPPAARLRLVELPLAARAILAGIKTSAVINVGTATLGAIIGAGGYGEPILTGIRLDDVGLILQGAIPAAVLALLVQGLFELAERRLVPKGLRLKPLGE
jgi:osmoprotectant transport system permease protein